MPEFPVLDVSIPEWREPSHPFSRGQNPRFYTPETLEDKALGKTARTDFFEKILVGLFWKLGTPVPYAFKTDSGDVRSLDAGCMKFLANRGEEEIVFHLADDRTIMAASPGPKLLSRLEPLRSKLVEQVTVDMPSIVAELDFNLTDQIDERRKVESLTVIREGQREFRKGILSAWGRHCAITKSVTLQVLEAAHIFKYLGVKTNDLRNGIALRSDVHVLFDKHLIGLEPDKESLRVVISKLIRHSEYAAYDGQWVKLEMDIAARPDKHILQHRFDEFLVAESGRV